MTLLAFLSMSPMVYLLGNHKGGDLMPSPIAQYRLRDSAGALAKK
jgi:hypothetical protein